MNKIAACCVMVRRLYLSSDLCITSLLGQNLCCGGGRLYVTVEMLLLENQFLARPFSVWVLAASVDH